MSEIIQTGLNPELVRQALAGYKSANEMIGCMKRIGLATMTDVESRKIYDSLCEVYYGRPRAGNQSDIQPAVALRKKMDKLGGRDE